jgi:hypothetical protein
MSIRLIAARFAGDRYGLFGDSDSTGGRVNEMANERIEKALELARQDGQIDGAHHKMWVIDQMVRALTGCPMVLMKGSDYGGKPFEYEAQGESEEYRQLIADAKAGEDGADTYSWDTGIAP